MSKVNIYISFVFILLAASAGAQTVDSIIQKHIAATGGLENWKKIHSITKHCVRNSRGVDIPITITILQDKGYKYESIINGMTSFTIITDKEGWRFSASRNLKPEAMTEDAVKQSQSILDIRGPLIDYKAKGNKITYLGTDDVDGTECHKLKVILPTGKEETYFIDASDYSLARIPVKTVENGREVVVTDTYGSYQKLPEGVVFPMSDDFSNGSLVIKSIEINKDIDESFFKPAYK